MVFNWTSKNGYSNQKWVLSQMPTDHGIVWVAANQNELRWVLSLLERRKAAHAYEFAINLVNHSWVVSVYNFGYAQYRPPFMTGMLREAYLRTKKKPGRVRQFRD